MIRFLKVRGKAGALVESPYVTEAPAHRRYVGMRRVASPPIGGHFVDHFEPCEEIVRDDFEHHIRKACKDGDLELLGECHALTHQEAIVDFDKQANVKSAAVAAPRAKTTNEGSAQ